jgi:VIT1/CCC1 family predicted Fe2+/Mn2+ transporter
LLGFNKYKFRTDARPTLLSNFILGSQDGLVNVLGIILGVSAATTDIRIIIVAALAALGAESISMGAVAYTSTVARARYYSKELKIEEKKIKNKLPSEKEQVREILKLWGYKGKELEGMTQRISSNPKATLEFIMSYKKKLAPVEKSEALRSFIVVGLATIFGSAIPLIPFLFFVGNIGSAVIASVIISGAILFLIGVYEAKTTVGSLWKSGLQLAIIGLAAGFAGYLIGHFIGAIPV